jgi:CubicO group peptidase (beta-lactamase class C family)
MRTFPRQIAAMAAIGLALLGAMLRADQVDDYIESVRAEQQIPGLALLVVRDGQTVKSQGYGLANVEHQVPVTAETIFQTGSVGKQFTAAGVMLLVEDGRLALTDSVRKLLTDAPESWQPITVRHLLSHTGGLGDWPLGFNLQRNYTEAELLAAIYKSRQWSEPGAKWRYSNLGYVTLGILVGKVTGKHYGELLRERIFEPLGMASTRIINEADIVPHRAAGYRLLGGKLKNQEWVSPVMNSTADGSLYTNLVDLARWDAALSGDKMLKRATLDEMWTPVTLNDGTTNPGNYGYGWVIERAAGRKVVQHGGAWQGFTTHISRYLDDKLTVVVLTNLAAESYKKSPRISRGVAEIYLPALKAAESAAE